MRERFDLSPADHARVAEIDALVETGVGSIDTLVELLADPSWVVRRVVVAELARFGDPAIAALCSALVSRRSNEAVIAATVDTLAVSRGGADVAVLGLCASDRPAAVLCDAAQILGRRRCLAAVPTLEGLTTHADDNVAVAAVEALARIGHGAGLDAFVALTHQASFFRVFPAIEALGKIPGSAASGTLTALLASPLYALEATRALANAGEPGATGALATHLRDEDRTVARAAAVALCRLRVRFPEIDAQLKEAVSEEALVRLLSDAAPDEAVALCELLGVRSTRTSIAALFAALSQKPAVASAASATLVRLGSHIDLALSHALRDGASRTVVLPLVGGRDAVADDVVACLRDEDPEVRALACTALMRIGDARVVPALFPSIADEDSRVAHLAVGAIQSLGSADTERLTLDAARSTDARLRRAALGIIGYFGWASALPIVLDALRGDDARTSDQALAALAYIDDAEALAALFAASRDPRPRIRASAVRALAHVSMSPAIEREVERALSDEDAWVRYYACQSVARIPERGAELLRGLIDDPAGHVRIAVIDGLSTLPGPIALAALRVASGSADGDVRRAALTGIGRLAQPEALPLLLDAVHDPDAATRLMLASALASYGTPAVDEALAGMISDEDELVCTAAFQLLAQRMGAASTRLLCTLLVSPAFGARAAETLGAPERLCDLVDMLHTAPEPLASSIVEIVALGRAEPALLKVLRTGSAPARRAVAAALRGFDGRATREALELASTDDVDPEVRRRSALSMEH
ncbi:MAG: HEAT repeat domain-containing protein [Polyangia bacterium]